LKAALWPEGEIRQPTARHSARPLLKKCSQCSRN
jgi:hypothetical protein